MKERKKEVYVTVSLDKATAVLLQAIADQQTDGNRSQAVRMLVRQAVGAPSESTVKASAA